MRTNKLKWLSDANHNLHSGASQLQKQQQEKKKQAKKTVPTQQFQLVVNLLDSNTPGWENEQS